MTHRVVLLPGSVLPADLAYGGLVAALGDKADCCVKELEVYREAVPPLDYSLSTEVAGVLHEADARGWDTFHLVGYSGGGASSLAFAEQHPRRLRSLALLEPAWAGHWDWSPEHTELWNRYQALEELPAEEFMEGFRAIGVAPGVPQPPPPAGPTPWMAKRPAGIRAFLQAFRTENLSKAALAAFDKPVYYALGGLSNPHEYGEIATRLSKVFPDFTLEVFEERHHFDPPHRIEPARLAASLLALWDRCT
jgi:pimeloyl-ACP methyl ester carboxylesterase